MNIRRKCFQFVLLVLTIEIVSSLRLHNRTPDPMLFGKHPKQRETEKLEEDISTCPKVCVCQYEHFTDLSTYRWISHMQNRQPETAAARSDTQNRLGMENDIEAEEHFGDEIFLTNPYTKQATCILQDEMDSVKLVESLPHDLQSLILLYTGIGRNMTVNTSTLKTLNQLTTVEIRGTQDKSLRLVFDEPLSFIQHANFESITLLGSDTFNRPKNSSHPSDSFDYKPARELDTSYGAGVAYNLSTTVYTHNGKQKLGFEQPEDEFEILPYNVYKEEQKKARMPNFYGWEHLEVLRIHDCGLDELYWEMFDGLEALQHLSLERNKIVDVPAFALYGALHIKTLSLAHNSIQDLHYRALAGLLDLEMLDLSDNDLNKLSELSFPPFPKLEHIDFRQNPIRYIFPAAFWVMNETRTMMFDSRGTALELWPNEPFNSLRYLSELSIENVSVANLEQNIFSGLTSLKKLKLHGDVRKIEFDAFSGLVQLQELNASHCGIHEISMDAFMNVKKLQILDLSNNNIAYIPQGLLDDQTELVEIYLQSNQLRTLPSNFFLKPKLMLTRLVNNPWKCSCNMANWRPKITNQHRTPNAVERCITYFPTGEKLKCSFGSYTFDNKLAPRCENYNGRSVFYVLRKQLQCVLPHTTYPRTKDHNFKYPKAHNKSAHSSNSFSNSLEWNKSQHQPKMKQAPRQTHREPKQRHMISKTNNLEYVLRHNYQTRYTQQADATFGQRHEISNEI